MIKAHLKNRMIAAIAASALLNIGRMIYLDNDLGRLITRPAEIAAYTAASLVVFFLFFYVVDLVLARTGDEKAQIASQNLSRFFVDIVRSIRYVSLLRINSLTNLLFIVHNSFYKCTTNKQQSYSHTGF